jgi:hypothetical protein
MGGQRTDLDDQANRMRALWRSGRDKYRSFFAVLGDVRRELGDTALAEWCFTKLGISIGVITKASELLHETDMEIVKAELAAAKRKRPAVSQLLGRIRELEAENGELRTRLAAAESATPSPVERTKPLRDRAAYMREFMRRKRAAQRR